MLLFTEYFIGFSQVNSLTQPVLFSQLYRRIRIIFSRYVVAVFSTNAHTSSNRNVVHTCNITSALLNTIRTNSNMSHMSIFVANLELKDA